MKKKKSEERKKIMSEMEIKIKLYKVTNFKREIMKSKRAQRRKI